VTKRTKLGLFYVVMLVVLIAVGLLTICFAEMRQVVPMLITLIVYCAIANWAIVQYSRIWYSAPMESWQYEEKPR
jgi:hypothetical protein